MHIAFALNKGSFESGKKKGLINFNIRNVDGQTPLHDAAKSEGGVEKIIVYGDQIDPLAEDNHKRIPLHLACINGNISFILHLLKKYPDKIEIFWTTKDCEGKTPHQYLSKENVLQLLVSLLEEIRLENEEPNSPIPNILSFHFLLPLI